RHAAPDPEGLADRERVLGALLQHGADVADRLGSGLTSLSVVFPLERRRRKEQMGVIPSAECLQLPISWRQRRSLPLPTLGDGTYTGLPAFAREILEEVERFVATSGFGG